MKALVKFALGREGMGIREVPEPFPEKGEIKIEIKAVGICGSDIHTMIDERKANMPVTLGHEFVGEICKVGEGVDGFAVGDWVVALPAVGGCGVCHFCKNGEPTMCNQRASIGTHLNGAMAKYLVIPAQFAFQVPEEAEDRISLAAAEPFACCVHGIMEKIQVRPGDVAVVSGPGLMGLSCLQVLKACGVHVVVSGLPRDRERLETALAMGADKIATCFEELKVAVGALNQEGADVAIECATAAASAEACVDILRKQGTYLQIGVFGDRIPFDLSKVLRKELMVTGANCTTVGAWKKTLQMIKAGTADLRPLITCQYPLEEWEKGFDLVMSQTAFRVLLIP